MCLISFRFSNAITAKLTIVKWNAQNSTTAQFLKWLFFVISHQSKLPKVRDAQNFTDKERGVNWLQTALSNSKDTFINYHKMYIKRKLFLMKAN
jgi:hypothetical protein